jgi:hypothetical protein
MKIDEKINAVLNPSFIPPHEDWRLLTREERIARNQAAIALLRSWREDGDAEEQRETWAFLKQALDEDRLSNRKFFSQE